MLHALANMKKTRSKLLKTFGNHKSVLNQALITVDLVYMCLTDNSKTILLLAKSSENAWFHIYRCSKLQNYNISVKTNSCEKIFK